MWIQHLNPIGLKLFLMWVPDVKLLRLFHEEIQDLENLRSIAVPWTLYVGLGPLGSCFPNHLSVGT